MKRKIITGVMLALCASAMLDCGRKKATDPVGIALDAATDALKLAKDPKTAAAALDILTNALIALKEKNPEILNDRGKFQSAYEAFSEAYVETSVAQVGTVEFDAANGRLIPIGLLK